jgi:DNA polymerase-3 subunit alpha
MCGDGSVTAELVHLHVHSQYSLLDGALKVKDLVAQTKKLGMSAVALTDHGNMFGALQFYKACKDQGVQAILGCEVNVARHATGDGGRSGHPDEAVDHLVLLAASEAGYKNLVRIVSQGHVHPQSTVAPSVTLDVIEANKAGIIGLTGCMGGVVAQRILEYGEAAGRAELERLVARFEGGSLYVELQDHGLVEQSALNGILAATASDLGLPVVATNDAHFATREDGEGQLFLSCIANNKSYAEALAAHHGSFEMFLKAPEEMAHLFRDRPDAIRSTLEIAERCAGMKLKLGTPMLPTFPVPEGYDAESYFRKIATDGLEQRFAEMGPRRATLDEPGYRKRLASELDVIAKMNFPGYF